MRDRTQNEGPAGARESGSSSAPTGNSRPRARGGFVQRLTQKIGTLSSRQRADVAPETHADRDWRIDFQRMDELEAATVAGTTAPHAYAIRGVVIFGWEQFNGILAARNASKVSRRFEGDYLFHHRTAGAEPNGGTDLIIKWRDAIIFEIGLEEYQKFLLSRRQRLHGDTESG
jgi:hypothetical protein